MTLKRQQKKVSGKADLTSINTSRVHDGEANTIKEIFEEQSQTRLHIQELSLSGESDVVME